MPRILAKVAVVALALGALGGAAEAQQIDIRITTSDRAYATVGSRYDIDDGDDYARRRYVAPHHRDWDDDDRYSARSDRYYGRPVPDQGYWDRHSYRRPVVAQRYYIRQPDCRIVLKRKVNDWGYVTFKQKQVCD